MPCARLNVVLVACLLLGSGASILQDYTSVRTQGQMFTAPRDPGSELMSWSHVSLGGGFSPSTPGVLGSARAPLGWNETTMKGFNAPFGVVYDPVNGYVYVSNFASDSVSVLDPGTTRFIANISLGGVFQGGGNLVCDPATGNIYVGSTSDIFVIGAKTNTIISTLVIPIPGGALPDPMTYDAQTRDVFVLDGIGTNISVVNQTSVIATVSLPWQYAAGAVYDSTNHDVYATSFSFSYPPCSGSCYINRDYVSVINGSTFTVTPTPFTMLPEFRMLYLPAEEEIFTAGVRGNVSAFDPNTGRTTGILNLSAELGGLAYDSRNGLVYATNRYFGNAYNASSITPGNNVTIVDPRTDRSVGSIPVWSEPVGIAYDDRTDELFVANIGSGSVSVINLTSTYHVQFTETDLPPGANWSVAMDGKARVGPGPLDFVEPNGSFSYTVPSAVGYVPALAAGTVQVSGSDVTVLVQFHPPSYPVTVRESGLPAGTNWSVQLGARSAWSSSSEIVLSESNGTYPFTADEIGGYAVTPRNGTATVSGAAVSLIITYSKLSKSGSNVFLVYLDLALASVLAVLMAIFVLIGRGRKKRTRDQAGRASSTKLSIPGSCW